MNHNLNEQQSYIYTVHVYLNYFDIANHYSGMKKFDISKERINVRFE